MNDIGLIGLGSLLGVCGFLSVWVLNRISRDMSEIKNALNGLEKDMREGVAGLDRRVTIIETKCNGNHGGQ